MKLSLAIAKQVSELMSGVKLSASLCDSKPIRKMLEDGVLLKLQLGRSRAHIVSPEPNALKSYLLNNFGIADIVTYVERLKSTETTRADIIEVSGNSKLKTIRTFKGFLVNSYTELAASINKEPFLIQPVLGSFVFIYDYENFNIPEHVTVVGVENAENFRWIHRQASLFADITPLFVSRYPQSKDLIRWLKRIPNPYLHFGDLDFAGIQIYLSEFYCHIPERATFFIPPDLELLLQQYGNRSLYFRQANTFGIELEDPSLLRSISLFNKYKKVLEQEIFVNKTTK